MEPKELGRRLEELIRQRLAVPGVSRDDFQGASDRDIDALAKALAIRIPECARVFYRRAGEKTGHLQYGSDFRFGALAELTREARRDLEREGEPLPDDALVIFSHQGYDTLFIRTGRDDPDPPVYRYVEGTKRPTRRFEHFSDFVAWLFTGAPL